MTKLGVVVGEEIWTFFNEVYDDLADHYQTEIYQQKTFNVPLLNGRLNHWAYRRGLRSILKKNDVCFFEWASEFLAFASQLQKKCIVVTRLHSFELYEWAPRINWDFVDKIILVSRAMEQQFIALYPQQSHKTMVIYNGRPLDGFTPPVQREFNFRLGMLCNIKPIKRVYDVILMLYELRKMGHDAYLSIAGRPDSAGDFRYAAAIYRLVDELDLKEFVRFDGYVVDTTAWLQNIDIFISNSFWEGQQVAMIEAMATGCYCVSHFWNGAEEMLPRDNLYISETEMRQKIVEYSELSEAEKKKRQVQLRKIACEKFDIERTKAEIRQIIDALVLDRN